MQHNDTAKWFDHYRANITCSTELLCRAAARNIWHRYWIGGGRRETGLVEGIRVNDEDENTFDGREKKKERKKGNFFTRMNLSSQRLEYLIIIPYKFERINRSIFYLK